MSSLNLIMLFWKNRDNDNGEFQTIEMKGIRSFFQEIIGVVF